MNTVKNFITIHLQLLSKLDRCAGNCNTINNLSNRVCISNITEDLIREKDHVWDPVTCNCENGKYLASIMDDSVITCDELIEPYNEEIKPIPTNFKKKVCNYLPFY